MRTHFSVFRGYGQKTSLHPRPSHPRLHHRPDHPGTLPVQARLRVQRPLARHPRTSSAAPQPHPDLYRARVAGLVERIETEAALARSLQGTSVLGVEAILEKDPQHRPAAIDGSPAPLVHAATKAARKAFYDAYAWFVAAFREAAERLRQGDRTAPFPGGSFPPALPFVAG